MRLNARMGSCLAASCTSLGLGLGYSLSCVNSVAADSQATENEGSFHKLDVLDGAKLKLVQMVFRHGARTPLTTHTEFWKHSPEWGMCQPPPFKPVPLEIRSTDGQLEPENKSNTKQMAKKLPGGCFAGELTVVGHQQAHAVGRWMRERYVGSFGFLPKDYQEGLVQSRTTNYDRTIKTLQGVLSGLYPEGPACGGKIPVTTSGDMDEILIADTRSCPNLKFYLTLFQRSISEQARRDPDFAWALSETKRVLNLEDSFFHIHTWPMTEINDAMTSMKTHGKALPEGMTERLITVVNRLATREFSTMLAPSIRDESGRSMIRLSMGVLLDTLVSNMEKVAARSEAKAAEKLGARSDAKADEESTKLFLYSGHDSTVLPLLVSLGLELTEWPPYMSNIVFELWELPGPSKEHVVRVLFNERELQIPHCPIGQVASLKTFKDEVVGHFVLDRSTWGDACHVKMTHSDAAPHPEESDLSSMSGSEPKDVRP